MRTHLATLGLLATTSAAALNLPFLGPAPTSDLSSTTKTTSNDARPFQLRHALHVGGHRHPRLFRRRDFSSLDRRLIDYRASVSSDVFEQGIAGIEALETYASTQVLRKVKGKMWRPKGGMDRWERSRRRALLEDRKSRGSRKAAEELAEMDALRVADEAGELDWEEQETDLPDVEDMSTLRSLAMMTSNAYVLPGDGDWYDPIGHDYNVSDSFGWEEDGVRGHVFATPDNSTVVVSIKGTSAGFLWSGGNTAINDKLNDNLLFSCCCARVDWTWTPVCDCYRSSYRCAQPCLEESLISRSVYFPVATSLYNNVSLLYPHSTIWLAGHSLGGSLAALLGHTFGAPTVTFEAPADLLAAKRLHLPLPPGATWGEGKEGSGVTHVYHTADPIPMGVCTGLLSSCGTAGFALESRCHSGRTILFDTVGKNKWSVDVRTHSIKNVIKHVLVDDWDRSDPPPSDDPPEPPDQDGLRTEATAWRLRWPWSGKKPASNDTRPDEGGGDEDSEKKKKEEGNVPEAKVEACEGGDCFRWEFIDDFDEVMEARCSEGEKAK